MTQNLPEILQNEQTIRHLITGSFDSRILRIVEKSLNNPSSRDKFIEMMTREWSHRAKTLLSEDFNKTPEFARFVKKKSGEGVKDFNLPGEGYATFGLTCFSKSGLGHGSFARFQIEESGEPKAIFQVLYHWDHEKMINLAKGCPFPYEVRVASPKED